MDHALECFTDVAVFIGNELREFLCGEGFGGALQGVLHGIEDKLTEHGADAFGASGRGRRDDRVGVFTEPLDGGDAGRLGRDGAREFGCGSRETVFDGNKEAFLVVFGIGNEEEGTVDR